MLVGLKLPFSKLHTVKGSSVKVNSNSLTLLGSQPKRVPVVGAAGKGGVEAKCHLDFLTACIWHAFLNLKDCFSTKPVSHLELVQSSTRALVVVLVQKLTSLTF